MKTATITFTITEKKTTVKGEGITGIIIEQDITNTEIEDNFKILLTNLYEFNLTNQLQEAIKLENWKEFV